MVVRNRFVRAMRPSDTLSCPCGSSRFKLGGEIVALEEVADRIYIARGEGLQRTITPLETAVACANEKCGKEYDRASVWDQA
jgi:hypothetical protein